MARTLIKMKRGIAEILGDEMTAVFWPWIKELLLDPYVQLELEIFDLSIQNRDATNDNVTLEAAKAIARLLVGVKCATITSNAQRVAEFGLKNTSMPSPNATIRGFLDGTIFREPIVVGNIRAKLPSLKKPIIVGRHGYGDIYGGKEMRITVPGTAKLVFVPADCRESQEIVVHEFKGSGVLMAMHNLDDSIRSFAKACIKMAIEKKAPLWFACKDTISKIYHGLFRQIFMEEVETAKSELEAAGVEYSYYLIDDLAARLASTEGGMVLALMNFDGDVWSDFLASASGSLGLMTSVLVSPSGAFEYEAAHGTVTAHFRKHQKGEPTSTNSVASIFAWTGALKKRGELDGQPELVEFASTLERAVILTIEGGVMTKDLVALATSPPEKPAETRAFIEAIGTKLDELLAA